MKPIKLCVIATYVAVLLTLAVATIVEKIYGTAFVGVNVYGSWWFSALWGALAVGGLAYMLRQKLYRKPVAFLIHVALMAILLGAFTTHLFGKQGSVHLRSGEAVSSYSLKDDGAGETDQPLPFSIRLVDFVVENYPGTQSPMDYVSNVVFVSGEGVEDGKATVSMNHVAEHGGYRFFQSGYDEDGKGTYFAVSYDPWGIGLSYLGYGLLFLSMIVMLFVPNMGFRTTLRKMLSRTASRALCAMLMVFAVQTAEARIVEKPTALPQDVADKFGDLYVYYNGRVCPLQTLAKDFTLKVYGKQRYAGYTPEQVLTGWLFFPNSWSQTPMIKLKGEVKGEVGEGSTYVTYDQFFGTGGYRLKSVLESIRRGATVEGARSYEEADEKVRIIQMAMHSSSLVIFPYVSSDKGGLVWLSPSSRMPSDVGEEQRVFFRQTLNLLGELVNQKDYTQVGYVLDKIKKYQVKTAAGGLPTDARFRAEKAYNVANYTKPLSMAFATIGIVVFLVYVVRWARGRRVARWLDVSLFVLLIVAAVYLLGLICLRGYVSNHLPLSNGFETMQFMSLCVLALTLAIRRRFALIVPFGFLLCGLTLMVSTFGESNPRITNLMPVLASPLLSLHVSVIMVAYSLLAFMMLNGVAALIVRSIVHDEAEKRRQEETLYDVSQLMLYPALTFLAIGIFVGAIWANQSWGRYWGWDPKEVWALITFMVYAVPLHKSLVPSMANPHKGHLFFVLAFATVLMTYFGVNFLLGGMHSYS